jgi:hypothetical protein
MIRPRDDPKLRQLLEEASELLQDMASIRNRLDRFATLLQAQVDLLSGLAGEEGDIGNPERR